MNNVTVIIPVHEFNETVSGYLDKAIESVQKQVETEIPELIVVSGMNPDNDLYHYIESKNLPNCRFIRNDSGKSDYQSQVNFAVESVNTDYFTVLEFDDELSGTYMKNVNLHIKAYKDVDIFLSMIIEVNEKNEGIKLTNETTWAQQFVGENGEIGYLNINALKQYSDFKLSGAVIKKSEFINIGKYKSNIKLTFMYELLLRAFNNALKIYSIPKIGYKHLATREGSLFDGYLKNMSVTERKFWFETANNESNFINDRPIQYLKIQNESSEK